MKPDFSFSSAKKCGYFMDSVQPVNSRHYTAFAHLRLLRVRTQEPIVLEEGYREFDADGLLTVD